jgi:dipeptidyl aminopeptidase/acylaminoacyl peptidase
MTGMTTRDLSLLANADDVRIAPNGRQVAYTATVLDTEANRQRTSIWIADVDGTAPPYALTAGTWADTLPSWSPDGRQLAFARSLGPDTEGGVWVTPTDGSDEETRVCGWPDGVGELSWSPDGTRLAFVARCPEQSRYGTPGNRPEPAALPPRRVTHLFSRLNAEGWVYDRPPHLFVVPVDGSAPPVDLTEGPWPASGATWSPDGRRLAFVSARHADWDLDLCNDIWVVSAAGGEPTALTDTSASWSLLSWSPDGGRLAYVVVPTPLDEPRHGQVGTLELASRTQHEVTTILDRNASPYPDHHPPVWVGKSLWFRIEDRGAVHVYTAHDADGIPTLVVGGDRVVRAFHAVEIPDARPVLAAVITSPVELAEVHVSVDGEELRPLTDLTRSLRERVSLVAPIRFTATSADGTEVECWAMAPVGATATAPVPTILNIHGGPFTSYGWFFFDEFQLQVGAGFGVIYCNPRGSSGYSEAWGRAIRWPEAEHDPGSGWGGVDYEDVMACVAEACRRFDWIDAERLGVQGGSYGGYMTSWIVAHTDRFKAACSERAANNLLHLECDSDAAGGFRGYVGFTHVERPDLYTRQSPSTYVREMRTAMLLVHSEDDLRCPISQAEELFVGLRLLGRRPELVRFPGESHELSRSGSPAHRAQRADIILEWFAERLQFSTKHETRAGVVDAAEAPVSSTRDLVGWRSHAHTPTAEPVD